MNKLFKNFIFISLLSLTSFSSCSKTHSRLVRDDWENHVKDSINECISTYGIDSKDYKNDKYVVFDFDNTSAIFDIQEQLMIYQLEHLAFQCGKSELFTALSCGVEGELDDKFGEHDFTYREILNDICDNYSSLYSNYGPFTYKGISDETLLNEIHNSNEYKDFSTKLGYMYGLLDEVKGCVISYPWINYTFTGMSEDEIYDLEKRCLTYYSSHSTSIETRTSVTSIGTSSEKANLTYTSGVSVSENIKELYKSLKDNGIDVWIVSASGIDEVRAAVDVYGLSDYVKGVLAFTINKNKMGNYTQGYNYTSGTGYIRENNKWVKMSTVNKHMTNRVGKSLAIKDVIAPLYNNKGPLMGFMDSTGDFNFCTEFKDTKLVVCFNRADRSVKDGGGLISAIAMYQLENNVDFKKTDESGDTLYLLQGRDENGTRKFINSNKTIKCGTEEEKLFKDDNNYKLLSYIKDNKLSIKDAINTLCKQDTKIGDIEVGFLEEYDGYHSR